MIIKEENLLNVYFGLAKFYNDDTARQLEMLELADKHLPPSYAKYLELAYQYTDLNNDKRLAFLIKAQEICETHDILVEIASHYTTILKDAVNGAKYFKKAFELEPNDYYVWSDYYRYKNFAINQTEVDKLIEKYNRQIKKTSDSMMLTECYIEISQIYRALKEHDKHLEYLYFALEQSPNDILCLMDIVSVYKRHLKNDDKALEYLKKVLEIDPDNYYAKEDLYIVARRVEYNATLEAEKKQGD